MLEAFLVKQKIKGPCWLTIKDATKNNEFKMTWCKHEIIVSSPKNIYATIDDLNKESPPMVGLTFAIKTTRSE